MSSNCALKKLILQQFGSKTHHMQGNLYDNIFYNWHMTNIHTVSKQLEKGFAMW